MVKTSWRASLAAVALLLAFASPVRGAVIDFEDVTPNIFAPDEGFASRGFNFTILLNGIGVVDSAIGFAFGNAPPNASGQFAAVLNAGGIAMDAGGSAFALTGFDVAFIAPLPEIGPPGVPIGEIVLLALGAAGQVFQATLLLPAADAAGNYLFDTIVASQLSALSEPLLGVGFFSCIYVGQDCVFDDNQAQFALDNIRVAFVPETSSLAFAVLALALAGAVRRRTAR